MKPMKKFRMLSALLMVFVMLLALTACGEKEPETTVPQPTTIMEIPQGDNTQTAFLGDNLYITDIGKYTGVYMEDGSDEVVSNVLMVILKNDGEKALQLARINLQYAEFTANFEVTNLPAGESVVLLEKNRHAYVEDGYIRATTDNVTFFREPMSLKEDQVKLSGVNGAITVENLTDQTFGEIYVYYKNSATDLYYGGITYRARVEAGLKPGRSTTVMTNHYYPNACTIIDVQIMPAE